MVWHPRNSKKYICTPIHVFKRIYLAFSIENWMLQRCLRKNSDFFYRFLRYPHCQIMTSFMGYLSTSNIAYSQASCWNKLKFLSIILILLFNSNTYLKAHSFTFYLQYKRQYSMTNLQNYSCASFVSPWWYKQRVCLNKWRHLNGNYVSM